MQIIETGLFQPCPDRKCLFSDLTRSNMAVCCPNVFDVALDGQVVSHIFARCPKEQNILQCLIKCLMSFKFYQTRSNTVGKSFQTGKYLMMFEQQKFPFEEGSVWTGFKVL